MRVCVCVPDYLALAAACISANARAVKSVEELGGEKREREKEREREGERETYLRANIWSRGGPAFQTLYEYIHISICIQVYTSDCTDASTYIHM